MHWRYSANQPQIGPIDASILIPLVVILIWPAKAHWSFDVIWYSSLFSIVGLWWIGRRGYTPAAAVLLAAAKLGQWMGRGSRPIHHTAHDIRLRKIR